MPQKCRKLDRTLDLSDPALSEVSLCPKPNFTCELGRQEQRNESADELLAKSVH